MTLNEAKDEADRRSVAELRAALNVDPAESPELIAKRFNLTIIQNPNGTLLVHPLHDDSYQVAGVQSVDGLMFPVLKAVLVCAFVSRFGM